MTAPNLPTAVAEAECCIELKPSLFLSQHSPVRDFDDVVCELHAFKGHGLSLHAGAGAVDESLEQHRDPSGDSEDSTAQFNFFFSGHLPGFGR